MPGAGCVLIGALGGGIVGFMAGVPFTGEGFWNQDLGSEMYPKLGESGIDVS